MLNEWRPILLRAGEILDAALLTITVSLTAFALAFVIGVLGALARRSRLWPVRWLVTGYVELFRNTPVLLQVFVAYFALPSVGLPLTGFQAGVLALALNVGAYLTEIVLAGLRSVPRGQLEAAAVLALTPGQTFRRIVFPQALRNVYPAVVNQLLQVILGSSLLSTIAVPELTGTAVVINAATLLTTQIFTVTLVVYLLLTYAVSLLASLFARFAFRPPLPRAGRTLPWRRLTLRTKAAA
jgi:polar amino acid transport system permease protein